jgi:anti-sigma factor RsiW
MREMPCQELVEVVTDHLDGALSELDRRRFAAHLAECVDCEEYVRQIRATIAAVGRLDANALSPDARQAVLQGFRSWRAALG